MRLSRRMALNIAAIHAALSPPSSVEPTSVIQMGLAVKARISVRLELNTCLKVSHPEGCVAPQLYPSTPTTST
jgi:hypothetical protein